METLEKHKLITGLVSIEWVHMNSFVRGFDNHCFLDGFISFLEQKRSWPVCAHMKDNINVDLSPNRWLDENA